MTASGQLDKVLSIQEYWQKTTNLGNVFIAWQFFLEFFNFIFTIAIYILTIYMYLLYIVSTVPALK